MSSPSDRIAQEGIRIAYDRYDADERELWENYAESRSFFDGRRYIRGTEVARRELARRIAGEVSFAREAAKAA